MASRTQKHLKCKIAMMKSFVVLRSPMNKMIIKLQKHHHRRRRCRRHCHPFTAPLIQWLRRAKVRGTKREHIQLKKFLRNRWKFHVKERHSVNTHSIPRFLWCICLFAFDAHFIQDSIPCVFSVFFLSLSWQNEWNWSILLNWCLIFHLNSSPVPLAFELINLFIYLFIWLRLSAHTNTHVYVSEFQLN